MGEVAAAVVAGALTLDEGARIIARRGQALVAAEGKGGLLAVALGAAEIEARIDRDGLPLSLAARNGPRASVVTGELAPIEALRRALKADGVLCGRVPIGFASHSAQMDPIVPGFVDANRAAVAEGRRGSAAVHGGRRDPPRALSSTRRTGDATYGSLVRFADAVEQVVQLGHRRFVEVGPHPVLLPLVEEILGRAATRRCCCRRVAAGRMKAASSPTP